MIRRAPRPRAYAPDPSAPGCPCDMPGCPLAGEYRAPKSRDALNQYRWFCLDHVREYNAKWDFYQGMSATQIETQLRQDTGWQRPTWPLGRLGGGRLDPDALEEALDALGARRKARAAQPARHAAPAELRQPLDMLGLEWPTTIETVKSRYKTLAKLHHPDANGGSQASEERLKLINLAYAAIRARLVGEPKVA